MPNARKKEISENCASQTCPHSAYLSVLLRYIHVSPLKGGWVSFFTPKGDGDCFDAIERGEYVAGLASFERAVQELVKQTVERRANAKK